MTINIRPVGEHEYERWLPLWQGYIEFYQASMPDENTAALWRRIHNPAHEIECRVAENTDTGTLVGLVHYVEQTTTWNINPVCYLNDLFVIPGIRGGAVGEALINAVVAEARIHGWDEVYWLTQQDNKVARGLYDKLTGGTEGFVNYCIITEASNQPD